MPVQKPYLFLSELFSFMYCSYFFIETKREDLSRPGKSSEGRGYAVSPFPFLAQLTLCFPEGSHAVMLSQVLDRGIAHPGMLLRFPRGESRDSTRIISQIR